MRTPDKFTIEINERLLLAFKFKFSSDPYSRYRIIVITLS